MLSGSRPRGNSKAPGSGNTGMTGGRSKREGRLASIATMALRKEQRRQSPPPASHRRIGRAERLEQRQQLCARSRLVPIAVAANALEQLLDRGFVFAPRRKRRG